MFITMSLQNELIEAQTAKGMVTKGLTRKFNRNWLARFYPVKGSRHTNQLVSITKLATIVDEGCKDPRHSIKTFENIINRLDDCTNDRLEVKLRRGVAFTFIAK